MNSSLLSFPFQCVLSKVVMLPCCCFVHVHLLMRAHAHAHTPKKTPPKRTVRKNAHDVPPVPPFPSPHPQPATPPYHHHRKELRHSGLRYLLHLCIALQTQTALLFPQQLFASALLLLPTKNKEISDLSKLQRRQAATNRNFAVEKGGYYSARSRSRSGICYRWNRYGRMEDVGC